jgi:ADP-heptose:LPS heptosyltransferase
MKSPTKMGTTIVTLKAFGDFLIAYSALLRASAGHPDADIQLLAGEHVRPLGLALGVPEAQVHYIGGSSLKDVPAAFDVRRRGLWAAWRSLAALRRAVHSAQPGHRQLVFDRLGLREQFIGCGRPRLALPQEAPNIYLAYDAHFLAGAAPAPRLQVGGAARRALIVAASRVPRKVLPSEVISQVHQQLAAQGVAAQVLLLEGEQVEVPRSVELVRVPRQFSALMASLRETDLVISADSLPAHIGEHLGKPTFVISPAPNPYWLPRAAFLQGGHGVFDNLGSLDAWLEQH